MLESSALSGIETYFDSLVYDTILFTWMSSMMSIIPSFEDIYHIISYHPDGHMSEAKHLVQQATDDAATDDDRDG